jgi:hypothetical protein
MVRWHQTRNLDDERESLPSFATAGFFRRAASFAPIGRNAYSACWD